MLTRKTFSFARYAKPLFLLLFWQFSVCIVYYSIFSCLVYRNLYFNYTRSVSLAAIVAITFLCLAPLASFVADVKCGRFKTLMFSTYILLVSNIVILIGFSGFVIVIAFHGYLNVLLLALAFAGSMAFLCGMVFFLANIVQFGTDQLRDAPTRYSIAFLYAVYWCERLVSLLVLCMTLPGQDEIIDRNHHHRHRPNKIRSILLITTASISIVLSIVVVTAVHKKKHWFSTEHSSTNPYLLVWRVLKFAAQHRKPIRRSAFTYCETGYPSRLDFGKLRYGGPFTTEQVEDVKTLFNILKVLLCLAPVFFLENCTIHRHHIHFFQPLTRWKQQIFEDGIISEALAVVFTPLLTKYLLSRLCPNMFKRMGFSIVCLLLIFALHTLYGAVGNDGSVKSDDFILQCKGNNTAGNIEDYNNSLSITFVSILLLENGIRFMYGASLYVAVWEFICCQSPQHMKGLLFGIFYAVRAFNQLLADFTIFISSRILPQEDVTCNRTLYLLNICLAVLLLIIFSVVSRRYRYRKRDDICNIYQYAENYYSNYGSIDN